MYHNQNNNVYIAVERNGEEHLYEHDRVPRGLMQVTTKCGKRIGNYGRAWWKYYGCREFTKCPRCYGFSQGSLWEFAE